MESFEKTITSELQKNFWNQTKSNYLSKFTKFFFFLTLINITLDFYQGLIEFKIEKIFIILVDISLIITFALTIVLLRKKKIVLGISIFFILSTILSILVSQIGGFGSGHHLYLLVVIFAIIFFIYNNDRKRTLLIFLFFFGIIIFSEFNNFSLLMKKEDLNEESIQLFFTESIIFTILSLIVSLEVLLRVYSKLILIFDHSNKNLIKIMESSDSNIFLFDSNFELKLKTENKKLENFITDLEMNSIKEKLSYIKKGDIFKNEFLSENNKWFKSYFKSIKLLDNTNLLLYIKEDITELKKKLEIISNKKNFLNDSTAGQILFLSNFSHEIRTPLNSISGLSEILLDKVDDENKLKLIELKKSAIYLADFINEILFLSKIENEKFSLNENRLEIINLIELLEIKLSESNLSKNIEILQGNLETRIVDADDSALILFLKNFIELLFESVGTKLNIKINSIDFSNRSQLICEFNFKTNETINILNEIFFEEELISQRDVSLYSIKIEILKNLIKFFNIRFEFLDFCDDKKIKLIFSFPKLHKTIYNEIKISDPKIIIIDDYLVNRIIIEEILSKLNLNFQSFSNANEFISSMDKINFDCIFLDLLMPDINGFEAAKIINSKLKNNKIPILAITALNEIDLETKLNEVGIIDLIQKPFDVKEVKLKLSKYLGLNFENN